MSSAVEVQAMWKTLRAELVEECGRNEKKLALAELLALRSLAVQAAAAKLKLGLQVSHRRKSFVR